MGFLKKLQQQNTAQFLTGSNIMREKNSEFGKLSATNKTTLFSFLTKTWVPAKSTKSLF